MMRRNTIKKQLLDGQTVIGTMVQEVMTPAIAQIFKVDGGLSVWQWKL